MKSLTILVVLVGVLIAQILAASVHDKKAAAISSKTKKSSNSNAKDDKIDKLKALISKLSEKKTTKAKRLLGEHECEDKCDDGHPECASWCHIKETLVHQRKIGEQLKKKIEHDRASVKVASAEARRKLELKSLLEKLRKKIDDGSLDGPNSDDADSSDSVDSSDSEDSEDSSDSEDDSDSKNDSGDDDCGSAECTSSLFEEFSSGEVLFNEIDDSLLPQICSALEDAGTCLQSGPVCNSTDWLIQWAEIYESLNYICTDGKDGLADYQTCLTTNEDDYYNEVFTCLETLPDLPDDDVPDPAAVCSFSNGILKCFADAAGDNCNSAEFVSTYLIDSNQLSLNSYVADCTLSYTASKKSKKTLLLKKLEKLLSDKK